MKRCVIVGGGCIEDYAQVRRRLLPEDYCVYCDCGLRHEVGLQRTPELIVGDFDSYPKPERAVELLVLPTRKDDTDSFFAVKEGLRRGFTSFFLTGMTGGRMDHTLANLSILPFLQKQGARATLCDGKSELELVDRQAEIREGCAYFSLLALFGTAQGVTVTGAEYPLRDACIAPEYPYGVSNRVLPGETARVTVEQGNLLLLRILKE